MSDESYLSLTTKPQGRWSLWFNILRNVLAAFGLLFVLVTFTPVVGGWARLLAGPWNDPRGDILILLGGSTNSTGLIGESSYHRSAYAISAMQRNEFRQLFITGGSSNEGSIPASVAMASFIEAHGVPSDHIRVEVNSRSTHENALLSRDALSGLSGKKVLMTSDYHMFRAYRTFRKAGIEVEPRPVPDILKRGDDLVSRWPAFVELCVETAKIVYYYVHGWM